MLKVLKEKSGKALSFARGFLKPWYIILTVLVLAVLFVLDWTADRKVNEHLPEAIDYIQKSSGLRCNIEELGYVFPNGVKALNVSISDDSGRQWLKASSVTANISPFRYVMTRKIGRHLIRDFHVDDLEVTVYHKKTGGWEFPKRKTTAAHSRSNPDVEEVPIDFKVHNLTINFQTEKSTTSYSYKKVVARIDRKRETGSLDVIGDDERFLLSINRESGEFHLKTESFGLAILSPFLGNTVPLNDIYISASAQGSPNKDKGMSFSVSGSVESRKKKTFLPPLEKKADLLEFNVQGNKDDDGISIQNGKLSIGGESLFIDGWVSNDDNPDIDMTFSFPDFSIGNALNTLPKSLHPDLPDLMVTGKLAGKFHFSIDMERPRSLKYRFDGNYEPIKVISLGSKIPVDSLKSPFHQTMHTTKGKKITFLVGDGNPRYVPFNNIPRSLISAVLTAEDGRFFSHKGFSERAIREAFVENLEAGHIVRGASTISMQVAKNVFLTRERTFSRKFEEAFITMALEQNLSKKRIMEIYLNIIEWGNGIYGIGPAARYYFSKSPGELRPVESAFLASIIARPTKNWRPDPLSKIGGGWWRYLQLILCRMYERDSAGIEDLREAGVSEERIKELTGEDEEDEENETVPAPTE